MRQLKGLLALLVLLAGLPFDLAASQDIMQRVASALSEQVERTVSEIDQGSGELVVQTELLSATLENSPGTSVSMITFQALIELERGKLSQRFELVSAGSDTHIETALEQAIETAVRIIRSKIALGPLYAGSPRIVGVREGLLYLVIPASLDPQPGELFSIREQETQREIARIQIFERMGSNEDGDIQALADLLFSSRALEACELLSPLDGDAHVSISLSQSIGATSLSLGYHPLSSPAHPSFRALLTADVGFYAGIDSIDWLTDSESVRLSVEAQLYQRVEPRRVKAVDRGYYSDLAAGLGCGIDLLTLSAIVTSSCSVRIGRYLPDGPQLGLEIGYRRTYGVSAGSLMVNTLSLGGFVTFGL